MNPINALKNEIAVLENDRDALTKKVCALTTQLETSIDDYVKTENQREELVDCIESFCRECPLRNTSECPKCTLNKVYVEHIQSIKNTI